MCFIRHTVVIRNETFYDDGSECMYKEFSEVYAKPALRHPQNGYGVEFRFFRAWYALQNKGNTK